MQNLPADYAFHKIKKGMGTSFLSKLFRWGINTFSPKYQGAVFVCKASGIKDGKARKVRSVADNNDGYLFTAAPVVACLRQYLDGTLKNPELGLMGIVVDPARLMRDMERMGIRISVEIRD